MKKAYIYTAIAVFGLLGSACSKNSAIDSFEGTGEYKITFGSLNVKATEELVVDDTKQTQVTIYDYYTKEGSDEAVYIAGDKIQETTTAGVWTFLTSEYSWKKGNHEFIGWVSKDENGVSPSTISFEDKVITVAETELPGTDNFDYMYSKDTVVVWPMETPGTVYLPMKHLSSALTYTFTNNTGDETYSLTSVSVGNIVNKAAASVTYGGDSEEVVNITNATKGSVTLKPNTGTEQVKTMVWPQTVEGATLTVNYTVTENNETVSKSTTVDIPDTVWEAGMVYNINIEAVNKSLTLTFTVLPWDLVDMTIDTSDGSINMSNVMWMNSKVKLTETGDEVNTVANSAYTVNMYYKPYVKQSDGTWSQYTANNGYFPAQGFFTVNYPEEGKFFMEVIPAYGQTTVDADAYEIYVYDSTTKAFRAINTEGEAISRTTVYFQVRAAAKNLTEKTEKKAQINIWFIPDGKTDKVSAYSEIRATYTLLIPAITE